MLVMPHITVCICTYRRPELLTKLLAALETQETGGLFSFSVVVADNDRNETARPVAAVFSQRAMLDVTYCVEPRRNIARARNEALAHAAGNYIAFIDDDEFPVPRWLHALFITLESNEAAGVLGPVMPYFETPPPRWAIEGRFFDRPRHATGYRIGLSEARTGNVLLRSTLLNGEQVVFRPEFGTGGEDVDFFRRMMDKGETFLWCDEAVAHEAVPPSRCTRTYLLKRAILRGTNSFRHKGNRIPDVLKSFLALPIYGLALPCLLAVGRHQFFRYFIKFCDHSGRLLAVFGLHPVKERDM
jgi:succinoglycan biosynthesis protein ExoM